jgi:predicted nucleic acid-binding protein
MVVVDTSVLIHLERNAEARRRFVRDDKGEIAVSAVTISELLAGAHSSKVSAETRRRVLRFVKWVRAQLPLFAVDLRVARVHAPIWTALHERAPGSTRTTSSSRRPPSRERRSS